MNERAALTPLRGRSGLLAERALRQLASQHSLYDLPELPSVKLARAILANDLPREASCLSCQSALRLARQVQAALTAERQQLRQELCELAEELEFCWALEPAARGTEG